MEEIIVDVLKVRGYGNIVEPKTVSNYDNYHSAVSSSSGVFSLDYASLTEMALLFDDVSVIRSENKVIFIFGDTYNIQATLVDDHGHGIRGVTVTLLKNGISYATGTTDSEGVVEFDVAMTSIGVDVLTCSFAGNASYGGSTSANVRVSVGGFDLHLYSDWYNMDPSDGSIYATQYITELTVNEGESFILNADCNSGDTSAGTYVNGALNLTTASSYSNGALTITANDVLIYSAGALGTTLLQLKLYEGNTLIYTTYGGFYDYSITKSSHGDYEYYVKVGDETSNSVIVHVLGKKDTSFTNISSTSNGFSAVLMDTSINAPIPNAAIKTYVTVNNVEFIVNDDGNGQYSIYQDLTQDAWCHTDSNGQLTISLPDVPVTKLMYPGDTYHKPTTWESD